MRSLSLDSSARRARLAGAALALVAVSPAFALTTGQPAPTAKARVSTATFAHDPGAARHVGVLRAGEPVQVVVSLKVRDKPGLDALTQRLMAGDPAAHPLSSAEFLQRHSPTEAQVAAVVAHLRANGFTGIEVTANRLMITANGSAATANAAFGADLHEYEVAGRRAFANAKDASVPAALADTVLAVGGLQTVHQSHVFSRPAPALASPQASNVGVSPTAWPAIYGATGLPTASNTSIGIITVGSMAPTLSDLRTFTSNVGFAMPSVTTIPINGGSNDTSETSEWDIDTQDALGAAGGAVKQLLLYATPSFTDANLSAAYSRAVSDNTAKIISVSIGGCETASSGIAADNQTFQAAIAQGQTFAIASGDSGAYECGANAGGAQSWPGASPYVMSIGGTTLSTNNGNTWAGETAWACSSGYNCQVSNGVGYGGGGGGPSLTQYASTAQKNAGVIGTSTARGVPDISFDGNPATGAYIVLNGSSALYGGTSLATPVFAGLFARIQTAKGNTIGFPAATLYAGAAAHPEWFHDVTSGSQGYSAHAGWDYATGYGSLQVGNFATAFTGTTPGSVITNGGFESGATGWTSSSGVVCANGSCASGETAHAGSNFAWLDGFGATHTDTLAQTVTLPAGKSSASLSFWLHIDTAESGSTAYDTLKLQVLNSAGTVLSTLGTWSNANAASGYQQRTFSLTPWLGQTVTLKFTGVEDSNLQTSFCIDDVAVAVQ